MIPGCLAGTKYTRLVRKYFIAEHVSFQDIVHKFPVRIVACFIAH